jgi:hypothetical protein
MGRKEGVLRAISGFCLVGGFLVDLVLGVALLLLWSVLVLVLWPFLGVLVVY